MSRRPPRNRDHLLAVMVGVVVIAALYFAKTILIPLALAILLTFILSPLVHLLERAHLGRVFSSVLVILLAVAAVGAAGWAITSQLASVLQQLPDYQQNILDKVQDLRGAPAEAIGKAASTVDEVKQRLAAPPAPDTLAPTERRKAPAPKEPVPVRLVKSPSLPLDSLQSALGMVTSAGLVMIFTLFMLIWREDLRNRVISLVGTGHLRTATEAMDDAAERVSRYLRMQLLVNACYGTIIGAGLHFIGLPGALLWGAIAGILRFVPYLGPPLGGIGPVLLSLAIFPGWHGAFYTLGMYVAIEISTSQFVEPILYGEHTGLSAVAVLVAAVFWTSLWGPIGLLLSTPLTVCLTVIGRRVPQLSFLHTLLGDKPVLSPETHFYQRMLAMDSREAREVLETRLKDHSLAEVYESVLVPALELAEQDRHNHALDQATEKFIFQNTKEIIEEVDLTSNHRQQENSSKESRQRAPLRVVSVPARDESDEIIGIMLAQLLRRAGYAADAVSLGSTNQIMAEIRELRPDIVCISALPPFAISHAHLLYNRLRTQWPQLKVFVGLWNFTGDLGVALKRMGMTEGGTILTSLSQVVKTVALASEVSEREAETHSRAGAR